MGKGDKPRNCFSRDFRDNYDGINWNNDNKTQTQPISTIEGMIRQSLDIPLECQHDCDDEQEKNCCANE